MMTQTWRDKIKAAPAWLRKALVVYIGLLHVAVIVMALKTNFLTLAGKTLGWIPPEEWNQDLWMLMLDAAQHDKQSPLGATVLIGDSLVASLGEAGLPPPTANLAIGGDTVRTLHRRLPTMRSIDKASALIVGVGVNDLKYRPLPEIAREYAALLANLPAGVPVVQLAVLPVDEQGAAARQRPYLRNGPIRALNDSLRQQCQARPDCHHIDPGSVLANPDGTAKGELYAPDGWHLSPSGTKAINHQIAQTLTQVQRP